MPLEALNIAENSCPVPGNSQCLPTMPGQAVNIAFSGLRSGDIQHFFDRRYHYSIINIVERGWDDLTPIVCGVNAGQQGPGKVAGITVTVRGFTLF